MLFYQVASAFKINFFVRKLHIIDKSQYFCKFRPRFIAELQQSFAGYQWFRQDFFPAETADFAEHEQPVIQVIA